MNPDGSSQLQQLQNRHYNQNGFSQYLISDSADLVTINYNHLQQPYNYNSSIQQQIDTKSNDLPKKNLINLDDNSATNANNRHSLNDTNDELDNDDPDLKKSYSIKRMKKMEPDLNDLSGSAANLEVITNVNGLVQTTCSPNMKTSSYSIFNGNMQPQPPQQQQQQQSIYYHNQANSISTTSSPSSQTSPLNHHTNMSSSSSSSNTTPYQYQLDLLNSRTTSLNSFNYLNEANSSNNHDHSSNVIRKSPNLNELNGSLNSNKDYLDLSSQLQYNSNGGVGNKRPKKDPILEYDFELAESIEFELGLKKQNGPRKNSWGNLSYAELITRAIESSSDQRLTLSQIYDWIVKYVPYFKEKFDRTSSAGWKVWIGFFLFLSFLF